MNPNFYENGEQVLDSGERRLRELGYKQELRRDLSWLTNFAFSFNVISILTGGTSLYSTGLLYGGPVVLVWGWILVSFMSLIVAASMAEICSAYPTSGGLYFWSALMAGPEWGPFCAWITGWFNALGLWAVTASVDFSLAQWIGTCIQVSGAPYPTKEEIIGIYAAILFVHAVINSMPVSWVAYLQVISVVWHIVGTFLIIIVLPAISPYHQSADYVFTTFQDNPGAGTDSKLYVFLLGLLYAQYTITGMDASAHMSEETKKADAWGAYGIVNSVAVSAVVGLMYILGLTFSIKDPATVTDPTNEAGGYAPAQIIYEAFFDRYHSLAAVLVVMQLVTVAMFFCGMSCISSSARMIFAFSRDGALPLSALWKLTHPTTGVPINSVWLCSLVAFVMGLPYLGSTTAFTAMTSIATIGLYTAYGMPVLIKLTIGRKNFTRGPFHLGPFSEVIGTCAVLWIMFIDILFCLPVTFPITIDNFQYASIAVVLLLSCVLTAWFCSAKSWFKGVFTFLVTARVIGYYEKTLEEEGAVQPGKGGEEIPMGAVEI